MTTIYYFIEDLTELDPTEEIPIMDNLVLKTIPIELQDDLKSLIMEFYPRTRRTYFPVKFNDFSNSFHEYKKKSDLPSGGHSLVKRQPTDFRYFVLEETNSSQFNMIYPKAFSLAEKDFFMPFSFVMHDNPVIKTSFSELCIYTYYNDLNIIQPWRKRENPKDFSNSDKAEILNYIELLNNFETLKGQFPYIDKALQDFFLITEISNYSVFKIVSYIACLELLLVDNNQERLKSISSQLQTKLNLLNNQFEFPIIISEYIKGPNTLTLGKVIEVLYNYRSSIAHGDFIDFSKKLQILEKVSEVEILKFTRIVLKKVLIYSIKNPNLISDLKRC